MSVALFLLLSLSLLLVFLAPRKLFLSARINKYQFDQAISVRPKTTNTYPVKEAFGVVVPHTTKEETTIASQIFRMSIHSSVARRPTILY
jgi:hypothetical protein